MKGLWQPISAHTPAFSEFRSGVICFSGYGAATFYATEYYKWPSRITAVEKNNVVWHMNYSNTLFCQHQWGKTELWPVNTLQYWMCFTFSRHKPAHVAVWTTQSRINIRHVSTKPKIQSLFFFILTSSYSNETMLTLLWLSNYPSILYSALSCSGPVVAGADCHTEQSISPDQEYFNFTAKELINGEMCVW